MELRQKGVILRCTITTHNKQMPKLPCASLFQIFSYVSTKYYLHWFTVKRKLSQK